MHADICSSRSWAVFAGRLVLLASLGVSVAAQASSGEAPAAEVPRGYWERALQLLGSEDASACAVSLLQRSAVARQRGAGQQTQSSAEQLVVAANRSSGREAKERSLSGAADAAAASRHVAVATVESAAHRLGCDWWDPFSCIWQSIEGALGVPEESPAPLGGRSVTFINIAVLCVLVGLLAVVGLGKLVDLTWPELLGKNQSPVWVLAWVLASYGLLVPGICCVLFTFNIFASFTVFGIFSVNVNLTTNAEHQPSSISDGMLDLIHVLVKTGGYLGAALVLFYAVVIPVVKLGLVVLGEYWRNGTEDQRACSRRMFLAVQVVSKWACPDMFAYILMLYLFRNMNHPPKLQTAARLELGFICFAFFCLSSTFASLAIPLPAVQASDPHKSSPPWCLRMCGAEGFKVSAVVLFICFFAGLGVGILSPCMAVKLELSQMHIPENIKQVLVSQDFEALVGAEVSIWKCVYALANWLYTCQASIVLALFLMSLMVVLLPAFNMILLLYIAFTHRLSPASSKDTDDETDQRTPGWHMTIARYIKHVAMLDVFVMGVVVVCAAGAAYRKSGVEIFMRWGMYPLIIAELLHYAMFFLVSSLCDDE